MKNFADFVSKLNKVNFTSIDGKTLIGEFLGNEVTLNLSIKVLQFAETETPLQAILSLSINGSQVAFWGACDQKDNSDMVRFWNATKGYVVNEAYSIEDAQRKQAKQLFEVL